MERHILFIGEIWPGVCLLLISLKKNIDHWWSTVIAHAFFIRVFHSYAEYTHEKIMRLYGICFCLIAIIEGSIYFLNTSRFWRSKFWYFFVKLKICYKNIIKYFRILRKSHLTFRKWIKPSIIFISQKSVQDRASRKSSDYGGFFINCYARLLLIFM